MLIPGLWIGLAPCSAWGDNSKVVSPISKSFAAILSLFSIFGEHFKFYFVLFRMLCYYSKIFYYFLYSNTAFNLFIYTSHVSILT